MEDDSSPFNTFGKGFKRIFGKGRWTAGEDLTEQEIMSMVNEGHENGVLQESEAEMINNIFTLDQKEAKDIMTHRKQIMALDGTCSLQEVLAEIRDMGYSRYPVYLDDVDNIIGIIHIKDILNQMLPNAELTYREGLPNLYCGMFVVILLVFYWISRTIPLREKLLNGAFLVFLIFSLNINKLDFIWHGFHFPNQLPYRYTFMICFLLIAMAYQVFQRVDEIRVNHLWILLAAGGDTICWRRRF